MPEYSRVGYRCDLYRSCSAQNVQSSSHISGIDSNYQLLLFQCAAFIQEEVFQKAVQIKCLDRKIMMCALSFFEL